MEEGRSHIPYQSCFPINSFSDASTT